MIGFKDQSVPERKERKAETRIKGKAKKLSWKEKKELDSIEGEILEAEKEVDRIEKLFLSPDFYKTYAFQVNQINLELESAKEKVKYLYDRWSILEQLSRESSAE